MSSVLVLSGQHSKISQPRWLIDDRHWFLTVPEAGSRRSGCQQWGRGLSSLLVSSHGQALEGSVTSPIRALSPFMEAPPSWPQNPPETFASNRITLALGFQHVNLGGTQTFRPQHGCRQVRECWGWARNGGQSGPVACILLKAWHRHQIDLDGRAVRS